MTTPTAPLAVAMTKEATRAYPLCTCRVQEVEPCQHCGSAAGGFSFFLIEGALLTLTLCDDCTRHAFRKISHPIKLHGPGAGVDALGMIGRPTRRRKPGAE